MKFLVYGRYWTLRTSTSDGFSLNFFSGINLLIESEIDVLQSYQPLVGNKAPNFEAEAVFDQEFINVGSVF